MSFCVGGVQKMAEIERRSELVQIISFWELLYISLLMFFRAHPVIKLFQRCKGICPKRIHISAMLFIDIRHHKIAQNACVRHCSFRDLLKDISHIQERSRSGSSGNSAHHIDQQFVNIRVILDQCHDLALDRLFHFIDVVKEQHTADLTNSAGSFFSGYLVDPLIEPLPAFHSLFLFFLNVLDQFRNRRDGNVTELIAEFVKSGNSVGEFLNGIIRIDLQKADVQRRIRHRSTGFIHRQDHTGLDLIFDSDQGIRAGSSKAYKQDCRPFIVLNSGATVINSSIF